MINSIEQFVATCREADIKLFVLPSGALRTEDGNYCPITALCAKLERKWLDLGRFHQAAALLGIDEVIAEDIVNAADRYGNYNERYRESLLRLLL